MSDQAHKPSDRPGDLEVPELDLAGPPRSGGAAKANVGVSGTSKSSDPLRPPPPSGPPAAAYGGTFDFGDEMEIDRNVVPSPQIATGSGPPRSFGTAGRIELADDVVQDRLSSSSHVEVTPRTNWRGGVLGALIVSTFTGSAGYALLRVVHRRSGWSVTPFVQKALDGSSATWSGAASLMVLAVAITLTIMAMYAKPRSLGYGIAALAAVTIGITLMIITFSVGPDGAPDVPPDGAVLVPWLLGGIPLGVALRLVRNAWDKCLDGGAKNVLSGAFLAALAAGVAFVAGELLFGAGLGRLL